MTVQLKDRHCWHHALRLQWRRHAGWICRRIGEVGKLFRQASLAPFEVAPDCNSRSLSLVPYQWSTLTRLSTLFTLMLFD